MSQEATIRLLGDPATYPHRPAAVEHLQTHISHVFLAGPYVYKLKKAVRFSFLDFSTPEGRARFCAEEIRLNRRLCPEIYLDVLPVVRDAAGALRLGGEGIVVDYVVWMRRLPAERLLTRLLAAGAAREDMMDALARRLAAFHAAAASGPEVEAHAAPERLAALWQETLALPPAALGTLLAAEDHEVLVDFGPTFVGTHETLLRARQRGGRIREGHGDLHAEHVCFVEAAEPGPAGLPPLAPGIYVFDCVEFSHALRCNDVASEIAFLAMDLERLERPDLARRFVTVYAEAAGDPGVHRLLPFYACYRACVRGKVEALKSAEPEVEERDRAAAAARARRHFSLALRQAWAAGGPALVVVSGPSGSGKTTLAANLAAATGFTLLGSDVLRKRRAGLGLETVAAAPYAAGLYTPAARAAVYEALGREADAALAAGRGVIADATFIRRADRARLAAVARARRVPHLLLVCHADEGAIRARLAAREAAPSLSDARWDTYLAQRARTEAPGDDEPHVVVDTGGDVATARAAALRALWRWRCGRPAERDARREA